MQAVQAIETNDQTTLDAPILRLVPKHRVSDADRRSHLLELAWYVDMSEGELGCTGSTIYSQLCGGSVVARPAGDELQGLERDRMMRAAAREKPIRRALSRLPLTQQHVLMLGVTRAHVRRLSWLERWFGDGMGLLCAYLAGSIDIPKPNPARTASLVARAKSEFDAAFRAYLLEAEEEDFVF